MDELGSGILNVNRLIDNYAPGRKPQFVEGTVFKTIIPVGSEVTGNVVKEEISVLEKMAL